MYISLRPDFQQLATRPCTYCTNTGSILANCHSCLKASNYPQPHPKSQLKSERSTKTSSVFTEIRGSGQMFQPIVHTHLVPDQKNPTCFTLRSGTISSVSAYESETSASEWTKVITFYLTQKKSHPKPLEARGGGDNFLPV